MHGEETVPDTGWPGSAPSSRVVMSGGQLDSKAARGEAPHCCSPGKGCKGLELSGRIPRSLSLVTEQLFPLKFSLKFQCILLF